MESEFNLGDLKSTDFTNPMYDAIGNSESNDLASKSSAIYEIPEDLIDKKLGKGESFYETPSIGSAVLSPSSIVHRLSPQVQIRQTALNPTSADTDKDTQHLVEEDKSE